MKKITLTLLVTCLLVACFSACGHSHTPGKYQVSGPLTHETACAECNEIYTKDNHSLNDESVCTVCGAEVWKMDEGYLLYTYDEHGNMTLNAEYDLNGNAITQTVFTHSYDKQGNLVKTVETIDKKLNSESYYTVKNGESLLNLYIGYMEDGKFTNEYDENGNPVKLVSYDKDDNVLETSVSEYKKTPDGEWYEYKYTTTYADGSKIVAEYDTFGNNTYLERFDANGTLLSTERWENVYGEGDMMESQKYYVDDVLKSESVFKTVEKEDFTINFPEIVTEYTEDGGKTVTVYNEDNEIIGQTTYDREGNIVS